MASLTADVRRLQYGPKHLMLDVEVVGQYAAASKIRINGVNCAPRTGRRAERIRKVNVARHVHGAGKRRIRSQSSHRVRHRLIEVNAGPGADHGLAFAAWIVREADARTEIGELPVIRAIDAGANLDEFVLSEIVN